MDLSKYPWTDQQGNRISWEEARPRVEEALAFINGQPARLKDFTMQAAVEMVEAAKQQVRDCDRMSNYLYVEPLLEWAGRHPELDLSGPIGEDGIHHETAMKKLIELADKQLEQR